jgi:hypothetical protein
MSRGEEDPLISNQIAAIGPGASLSTRLSRRKGIHEPLNETGSTFMTVGRKHWAIAQGWIPPIGDETVSLLNVSVEKAHVEITVYYSDRDPVDSYRITVPARRTKHVNFNYFTDPEPIPRTTDYASTIRIGRANRGTASETRFKPSGGRARHICLY